MSESSFALRDLPLQLLDLTVTLLEQTLQLLDALHLVVAMLARDNRVAQPRDGLAVRGIDELEATVAGSWRFGD